MENFNYENECKSLRSLVVRLAKEIDYKNHLLIEKTEENAEKDKLLSEKSKVITEVNEEKEQLLHQTFTVMSMLTQKQQKLDETSATISVLAAQNTEKERLLNETSESVNMLKGEKQKLSDDKNAEICALMAQNAEKERLIDEISSVVNNLMVEKNRWLDAYIKESSRIEKMKLENNKLLLDLESNKSELEILKNEQSKTVQKTETTNSSEIKQNCGLLLAEQWNNQELEEIRAQVNLLRKELEEKTEALQNSEMDNKTLIVKELRSNHELQAARTAAIDGFQDMGISRANIRIKRIGEVDQKPFRDVCSKRFSSGNWNADYGDCWVQKAMELCSLWQNNISDPAWQPFKNEDVNGKLTEVVDENDQALKELREEWGDGAYNAVVEAVLGVNEYNASGRYPISELWNFKENRRATLGEVIQYMIKKLRLCKKKK